MIPLLDRLCHDLPGEWQHGDASSEAWHADPIRTVYLTIGDRRLFVSARSNGSIVGEQGAARRVAKWKTLRRSICEGVARIALDHAREGKAIPAVPAWAQQALRTGASYRLRTLAEKEAKIRADLAAVAGECAWLTDLTLLASGHLETV